MASPHGHHPYREIICCPLQQTTIPSACNRARATALHVPIGVWSPGVRVESKRQKAAPWRPPESTSPLAKSFVLRQTVCKRLIFLPWHGRGREFESHQVHQAFQTLSVHWFAFVGTVIAGIWSLNLDASRFGPSCLAPDQGRERLIPNVRVRVASLHPRDGVAEGPTAAWFIKHEFGAYGLVIGYS